MIYLYYININNIIIHFVISTKYIVIFDISVLSFVKFDHIFFPKVFNTIKTTE